MRKGSCTRKSRFSVATRTSAARHSSSSTARTSSRPLARTRCYSSSDSNTGLPSFTEWHSKFPAVASRFPIRTSSPHSAKPWPRAKRRANRCCASSASRSAPSAASLRPWAAPKNPAPWIQPSQPPAARRCRRISRNYSNKPPNCAPPWPQPPSTASARMAARWPSPWATSWVSSPPTAPDSLSAWAKWAGVSGTSFPRTLARPTPKAECFQRSSGPW